MIQVHTAKISNDSKKLYLEISSDNNITSLKLWLNDNFKDYSKTIDLYPYLNLTDEITTESIVLTAEQLDIKEFSTLVFIEITDDSDNSNNENCDECNICTNTKIVVLTNFKKFFKCIGNYLNQLNLNNCANLLDGSSCCNPSLLEKISLIYLLIEGIKINLSLGKNMIAVELLKKLNKLCKICNKKTNISPGCSSCN